MPTLGNAMEAMLCLSAGIDPMTGKKLRSPITKDLRTPKYRSRIVKDKRKQKARMACRKGRKLR